MIIDNGTRETLVIDGVYNGMAGVAGAFVSFVPVVPERLRTVVSGTLAGVRVLLWPVKDADGPFWTARYQVVA